MSTETPSFGTAEKWYLSCGGLNSEVVLILRCEVSLYLCKRVRQGSVSGKKRKSTKRLVH